MIARTAALLGLLVALSAGPILAQDQERAAPAQQDTTAFSKPPISPGGAFLRSLVIPGWGQSALGAKSRGAFYFFMETASLLMLARTQIRLNHAERTEPEGSGLIDSRIEQREDWIVFAVFWAFASAADGFVAAHLYGFEERTGEGPGVSYVIGWRIPFGP